MDCVGGQQLFVPAVTLLHCYIIALKSLENW